MKLLFVQGGSRVKRDNNGNLYVDGNLNDKIFQRYLSYCNELAVFLREESKTYEECIAKQKFNAITKNPKIKILTTPDLVVPKTRILSLKIRNKIKSDLKKAIKDADKIIVRSPGNFYTINAAKIAKKLHKPLLVEVTGYIYDGYRYHGTKLGPIVARYYDEAARKIIRESDYVLYVTENFLQSHYPTKGKQLGCSDVEISQLDPQVLVKRLEKISKNKDALTLGTIGFLHIPLKGQQDVIRAVKILKDRGYKIRYQLVGIGDSTRLKYLVRELDLEDEVKFVGGLPHDQVLEWLQHIDIYIQPSYVEGVCRSVIEAMAMACPTIVSNGGGNIELCNPEFVFNRGDVNAIVELLLKMNQKARIKYAKINFERASSYVKNSLDQKRDQFYSQFKDEK
jgi:glycosyltransferase, group 1 family protein